MTRDRWRPEEREDRPDNPSATCDRCGETELEWVNCGTAGWKLYDGMKLHKCKAASAVDFEDLS